ncbi:hypothetical protein ACHAQA_009447, partial [Verticillium albo-atrum]
MPRSINSCHPTLGIRLDCDRTRFAPGDTITGYVYRSEQLVSPQASLRIALNGRSKSKLVHGVNSILQDDVYRGRFNFFSKSETTRLLHRGPVHVPGGGEEQTWPFSITIPTQIDPGSLQAKIVPKEQSYLSIDPKDVAVQPLPPTFDIDRAAITRDMQGFVEYFLQATLHFPGPQDDVFAVLPIPMPMLSDQPPIIDFKPCKSSVKKVVNSPRLMPGMENASLSFSKKASKLFRSSNVPSFFFRVDTGIPQVVQLNNPNPIPIRIRVVPDWGQTSDVFRKHLPKVKLKSISLEVASLTEILCDGFFMPHTGTSESTQSLNAETTFAALEREVFVPCTDDFELLDVGELISLRLGYHELTSKWFKGRFRPSFKTYNIKHWHVLHWKLKLDIVGEEVTVAGTQN